VHIFQGMCTYFCAIVICGIVGHRLFIFDLMASLYYIGVITKPLNHERTTDGWTT